MSDWPIAEISSSKFSESNGTIQVITSSKVNTKGAWSQVVGSTAYDYSGIIVWFDWSDPSGHEYMVDVGIGAAGSEVVLVPNLSQSRCSTADRLAHTCIYLPVRIPKGSRISLRSQSVVSGAQSSFVAVQGIVGGSPLEISGVDCLGANASLTTGVSVTPGANGTWGSWTTVVDSCPHDIKHLTAHLGSQNRTSGTQQFWSFQIGVGPVGSEQIIIGTQYTAETTVGIFVPQYTPGIFVDIPYGSRISIRGNKQGAGGNTCAFILYGAY